MNTVEPIRDLEKLEEIKKILKKRSARDFLMFIFGIQTGLRISDILKIKVGDVRGKKHLPLKETKTKKDRNALLNSYLRDFIEEFIEDKNDNDFLFQSQKKGKDGINKPISRQQAYDILNEAAKEAGLEDNIGTHTLRKTFGYHFYKKNKDVAMLMNLFNHSAPSVTLRYIGINQDLQDEALEDFIL